ncbi:MAG: Cof-type HAD-IIB family hydrolase [Lachnospiraceae bacterium]|nr:Cof-type HAD-IIB family hydrolase [Lachnospiraceae bacterium]
MKEYRLIAVDMDGTLLTSDKRVAEETQEDIRRAIEAGKDVVLSTGRGLSELVDYREVLSNVRYGITASGGLIYDSWEKKSLFRAEFDRDLIREIFEEVRPEAPMVHFFSGHKSVVQSDQVHHMADYHMGIYQDMFLAKTEQVEDIYSAVDNYPEIEKINVYFRSKEDRSRHLERMNALPVTYAFSVESLSVEISPKGISKGSGLLWLCDYLGIDPTQTIAVGDGDNDRAVLKSAGLSVAMGNAGTAIQTLCDEKVSDNDHNGVGEAIRRFLL